MRRVPSLNQWNHRHMTVFNTSWIDDEAMRKKAETGMTQLRRRNGLLERHVKINVEGQNNTLSLTNSSVFQAAANKFPDATAQLEDSYFPTDKSQRAFSRMPLHLRIYWSHELETSEVDDNKLTILEKMT